MMALSGLPRKHFGCVVADPPWLFKSNSVARPGRNAMGHYQCMSLTDIAALPIAPLLADNAALFLWITGPLLALGAHLPIMRAWGFKPSGMGFDDEHQELCRAAWAIYDAKMKETRTAVATARSALLRAERAMKAAAVQFEAEQVENIAEANIRRQNLRAAVLGTPVLSGDVESAIHVTKREGAAVSLARVTCESAKAMLVHNHTGGRPR